MKISVLKIGKPAFPEVRALVGEYEKRLQGFHNFQVAESKTLSAPKHGEFRVLLDERGQTFSTPDFTKHFQSWLENPSHKAVTFAVGGPYGFTEEDRETSQCLWALSPLVLQGDIAWLVTCEQIYRAYTLMRHMDYHH